MLQNDSDTLRETKSSVCPTGKRRVLTRRDAAATSQKPLEILSFPQWARIGAGSPADAANAQFCAGASLALFDHILRGGEGGAEPVVAGALRQRLALKGAASSARLARAREDEAALRDVEHFSGVGVETSPAGHLHRLCRLLHRAP